METEVVEKPSEKKTRKNWKKECHALQMALKEKSQSNEYWMESSRELKSHLVELGYEVNFLPLRAQVIFPKKKGWFERFWAYWD